MIECEDFDLSTGFYLVFMYSLSVVAVPLNLLSFYCILTKSPKQMAAYKWYLLIYQIISTVFDSVYLVLTLPIIFFPIPMGYPTSWTIPWIPITTHMGVLLVIYIGSLFGATIVSLFVYRCHVIAPARHFSRIGHRGHIFKSAAIYLTYFTPILISSYDILPDQAEARMWAENEYTCARSAFSVPNLQIFIPFKLRRLVLTIIFVCCIALVISIASVIASHKFLRENSSMSQKTKQMQKRFLRSLFIQVSIPLASMLLPIASLMFIVGTTNSTGRGIGNFILAVLGSHGSLAATMLILCNAPYRKFVTTPIRRWTVKKPNIIVCRSIGAYSNQQQAT